MPRIEIWALIQAGPGILAALIVDTRLMPDHPELDRRLEWDSRCREIVRVTALYFLCLVLATAVAGAMLTIMGPALSQLLHAFHPPTTHSEFDSRTK
jgi:hypothetical protein